MQWRATSKQRNEQSMRYFIRKSLFIVFHIFVYIIRVLEHLSSYFIIFISLNCFVKCLRRTITKFKTTIFDWIVHISIEMGQHQKVYSKSECSISSQFLSWSDFVTKIELYLCTTCCNVQVIKWLKVVVLLWGKKSHTKLKYPEKRLRGIISGCDRWHRVEKATEKNNKQK